MIGEHRQAIQPEGGTAELLWPVRRITPGELRVLQLVALGLTSREIAGRLWVSRQAVTYHIGNLLMKLRADSRAGLVARAYAIGVLSPGTWPPVIDPAFALMADFAARSAQPPRPAALSPSRSTRREDLHQMSAAAVDPDRERAG
jgi:DNA-binding CsgD family transcriptional regulator